MVPTRIMEINYPYYGLNSKLSLNIREREDKNKNIK